MVYNITAQNEIGRHVNRLLSPNEMRKIAAQARIERSIAFKGLWSNMGYGIRDFFVNERR
jgi:hypothetical protein